MSIGGVDKLSYSEKKKRKQGESEPIVIEVDSDVVLENAMKRAKLKKNGSKGAAVVNKKKKPTEKQKRLAKLLVKNTSADKPRSDKELAIEAGYSVSTAGTQQGRLASSPGVKKALAEWGFTPERVNEVIDRALDAKDSSWFKGKRIESNAPDHKVQLAAISTLGDFTGLKKYSVEQKSINVNIDGSELADLLDL